MMYEEPVVQVVDPIVDFRMHQATEACGQSHKRPRISISENLGHFSGPA
jgi:hypothetical protein